MPKEICYEYLVNDVEVDLISGLALILADELSEKLLEQTT